MLSEIAIKYHFDFFPTMESYIQYCTVCVIVYTFSIAMTETNNVFCAFYTCVWASLEACPPVKIEAFSS